MIPRRGYTFTVQDMVRVLPAGARPPHDMTATAHASEPPLFFGLLMVLIVRAQQQGRHACAVAGWKPCYSRHWRIP